MSSSEIEIKKLTRDRQFYNDINCLKRVYGNNPSAYEKALTKLKQVYGNLDEFNPAASLILPFHPITNNYSEIDARSEQEKRAEEAARKARWENYANSSENARAEALQYSPYHNSNISAQNKAYGYTLLCQRELESKYARVKPLFIPEADWVEQLRKRGQTPLTAEEVSAASVQYPQVHRVLRPGM